MARVLINAPRSVKKGSVFQIKTLINHVMEPGFRPGPDGKIIPQDIITTMTCKYNGEEIFRAELHPAMAANPFMTFFTTATESGTLEFAWTGDNGFSETASSAITVE